MENDICIQVTCKISCEKQRYGYTDLINEDAKFNNKPLENFNRQFVFSETENIDKIFRDVFEEQNLLKFYVEGFDINIVKYGKRNIFYETADETSSSSAFKTDRISTSSDTSESTIDSSTSSSSEHNEVETGLVHNFIRSIFEELISLRDTQCLFSVGWTEINQQNQLLDLLNGNGLIQCTMSQLLETVSVGLRNRNNTNSNHNILSIVLEQQSINNATGQAIQKLSTVNFCDLNYGTDKALTNQLISEPMNFYSQPMLPPYPYFNSSPPTNFGNNFFNGNCFLSPPPVQHNVDNMFFNANFRPTFDVNPSSNLVNQQNQRLLRNAELLFSKLNLNDIEDDQRKEIQEWMYLKNECDTYLPIAQTPTTMELPPSYFSNMNANMLINPQPSMIQQQTSLLPIIEMDESNDQHNDDEEETNDNDSESGYIDINDQSNNLFTKISDKMSNFQDKTDDLVRNKCNEYFENNPKVILSSNQSDSKPAQENLHDEAIGGQDLMKLSTNTSTSEQYLAKTGRRRSIRDNNILNSDELNLIKKAAAATSLETDSIKENAESEQLTKLDELRKSLKKSIASIDATNLQIKEVEQTIALKKNLITDLIENNKTRVTAKHKCNKKKSKYQSEYEKCKKDLSKAIMAGKNPLEIQRLKEMATKFEEKLLDLNGINEIAAESSSNKKVKQLHKSLEQSKKQLEVLNKVLKKEVKHKESIEKDIAKQMKSIEDNEDNESYNKKLVAVSPSPSSNSKFSDSKVKIRDVNARISHLDEILKEKSSNLQLSGMPGEDKEKESLRYEIRNLRRTRDTLLDQRVSLYKKLKRDKMLTYKEERKMLECDEAIEAIDDVIEVKNELICGHKSIDTNEKLEREKGEQLLMARLNKLSEEEMRILLYKYFMKVIDLKESCRKLEQNLMSLERDKEAWEWREKILTNAIRQSRLESERNLIIQQKNHETRLNLLLRHFANETTNSSLTDSTSNSGTPQPPHLPDYEELNIVKATKSASRHQYHQQHAQLHQTEIERDFKKNLFTKFHVFTRYHQQGGTSNALATVERDHNAIIPHENLKQLNEKKPATKVTRQKNKLIIQQNDKSKGH